MKKLPIFAKLLEIIPRSMLSSKLFEFLRYLYPFQRYSKFLFSSFFNSACLFNNLFSVFIVLFMLNSDPLEFLSYLLPFRRYR